MHPDICMYSIVHEGEVIVGWGGFTMYDEIDNFQRGQRIIPTSPYFNISYRQEQNFTEY